MTEKAAMRSLLEKDEDATYAVSQVCFDPKLIARWAVSVRERGSRLEIRIGLPGPVSRDRLLRISERIGVGDSIRLLAAEDSDVFDPEPLARGLAASPDLARANVVGVHVFTFNELAATERWRRSELARLREPLAAS